METGLGRSNSLPSPHFAPQHTGGNDSQGLRTKDEHSLDVITTDARFTVQDSELDDSVNWVVSGRKHGHLEARYVRRTAEKLVIYLSSQTGCIQACRMCHLTATGQTRYENASVNDLIKQSEQVLNWYDASAPSAQRVHYNFMARGEPLDNPQIIHNGHALLSQLAELSQARNLFPKYLVSTIFPQSFRDHTLEEVFPVIHPELYYSIYSTEPAFRKKWLPRSMPVQESMHLLKQWQDATSKIPKLHHPLIEGENDSTSAVEGICQLVRAVGLRVNINLIRYNPYSEKQGREPSLARYELIRKTYQSFLPESKVQIVSRVGYDVSAACGMFYS